LVAAVVTNFPYGITYVVAGAGASQFETMFSSGSLSWWKILLYALGFALSVVFTVYMHRVSKRMEAELNKEEKEYDSNVEIELKSGEHEEHSLSEKV